MENQFLQELDKELQSAHADVLSKEELVTFISSIRDRVHQEVISAKKRVSKQPSFAFPLSSSLLILSPRASRAGGARRESEQILLASPMARENPIRLLPSSPVQSFSRLLSHRPTVTVRNLPSSLPRSSGKGSPVHPVPFRNQKGGNTDIPPLTRERDPSLLSLQRMSSVLDKSDLFSPHFLAGTHIRTFDSGSFSYSSFSHQPAASGGGGDGGSSGKPQRKSVPGVEKSENKPTKNADGAAPHEEDMAIVLDVSEGNYSSSSSLSSSSYITCSFSGGLASSVSPEAQGELGRVGSLGGDGGVGSGCRKGSEKCYHSASFFAADGGRLSMCSPRPSSMGKLQGLMASWCSQSEGRQAIPTPSDPAVVLNPASTPRKDTSTSSELSRAWLLPSFPGGLGRTVAGNTEPVHDTEAAAPRKAEMEKGHVSQREEGKDPGGKVPDEVDRDIKELFPRPGRERTVSIATSHLDEKEEAMMAAEGKKMKHPKTMVQIIIPLRSSTKKDKETICDHFPVGGAEEVEEKEEEVVIVKENEKEEDRSVREEDEEDESDEEVEESIEDEVDEVTKMWERRRLFSRGLGNMRWETSRMLSVRSVEGSTSCSHSDSRSNNSNSSSMALHNNSKTLVAYACARMDRSRQQSFSIMEKKPLGEEGEASTKEKPPLTVHVPGSVPSSDAGVSYTSVLPVTPLMNRSDVTGIFHASCGISNREGEETRRNVSQTMQIFLEDTVEEAKTDRSSPVPPKTRMTLRPGAAVPPPPPPSYVLPSVPASLVHFTTEASSHPQSCVRPAKKGSVAGILKRNSRTSASSPTFWGTGSLPGHAAALPQPLLLLPGVGHITGSLTLAAEDILSLVSSPRQRRVTGAFEENRRGIQHGEEKPEGSSERRSVHSLTCGRPSSVMEVEDEEGKGKEVLSGCTSMGSSSPSTLGSRITPLPGLLHGTVGWSSPHGGDGLTFPSTTSFPSSLLTSPPPPSPINRTELLHDHVSHSVYHHASADLKEKQEAFGFPLVFAGHGRGLEREKSSVDVIRDVREGWEGKAMGMSSDRHAMSQEEIGEGEDGVHQQQRLSCATPLLRPHRKTVLPTEAEVVAKTKPGSLHLLRASIKEEVWKKTTTTDEKEPSAPTPQPPLPLDAEGEKKATSAFPDGPAVAPESKEGEKSCPQENVKHTTEDTPPSLVRNVTSSPSFVTSLETEWAPMEDVGSPLTVPLPTSAATSAPILSSPIVRVPSSAAPPLLMSFSSSSTVPSLGRAGECGGKTMIPSARSPGGVETFFPKRLSLVPPLVPNSTSGEFGNPLCVMDTDSSSSDAYSLVKRNANRKEEDGKEFPAEDTLGAAGRRFTSHSTYFSTSRGTRGRPVLLQPSSTASMMEAVEDAASLQSFPVEMFETIRLRKRKNRRTGVKYINDYALIKEIGRGSFSRVKLAYDNNQNRLVAIKQVRRARTRFHVGGPSESQQFYEGFMREIDILRNLRHKNIVSVYEIIDDPSASVVCLVMQYIDRGAIRKVEMQPGTNVVCEPILAEELVGYAKEMLAGLAYLHRKGVVHRDIKPENILINKEKQVYLADFGVAEAFDDRYCAKLERLMMASVAIPQTSAPASNPSASCIEPHHTEEGIGNVAPAVVSSSVFSPPPPSSPEPTGEVVTTTSPVPPPSLAFSLPTPPSGSWRAALAVSSADDVPSKVGVEKSQGASYAPAEAGAMASNIVSSSTSPEAWTELKSFLPVLFPSEEKSGGPLVLGIRGTMLYLAPELWTGRQSPGKPVDMWAMGVTLYTLLTGTLPFVQLDDIFNPNLPSIPTAYGMEWASLLRGMMHRDPAKRFTAAQALYYLRKMHAKVKSKERRRRSEMVRNSVHAKHSDEVLSSTSSPLSPGAVASIFPVAPRPPSLYPPPPVKDPADQPDFCWSTQDTNVFEQHDSNVSCCSSQEHLKKSTASPVGNRTGCALRYGAGSPNLTDSREGVLGAKRNEEDQTSLLRHGKQQDGVLHVPSLPTSDHGNHSNNSPITETEILADQP